ncbi:MULTISPECIES: sensor histidine kinase [Paenibacillus]|uniref:sensor histidine kinase n=1 Tax=Paenibacillus TaxID=44249 RepID=UPI0022B8AC84|nr:sensor histidine kinase [Paenibacillus caseinilyticus]MCZ8523990.1 sensor histidine kinase [Paenibacillus caseinilyticus]
MNPVTAVIRWSNNINIRNKLILSFVLVVFIPVMLVGGFLTYEFRETVLDHATQQTSNNVDKIKQRTLEIIRIPIDVSNKLLVDSRLSSLVNTRYDSTYQVVEAYRNYSEFREYNQLYKEILNIRLYTSNPTLIDNWDFIQPDAATTGSFWYRNAMANNRDTISWHYIEDETQNREKYLSLVRRVVFHDYRTSGVLVIPINADSLNAVVRQEPFDTMIMDEQGYIVAAKNPSWVGRNAAELDLGPDLLGRKTGTYEAEFGGKPSKVLVEDLLPEASGNGLKIVSIFTIESIVSGANRIALMGLVIILTSLSIAMVLIFFSSKLLSSRLFRLKEQLVQVSTGNLNVASTIDGNDEVGMLSRQFNYMVESIRTLMEEVSESNRQKSRLELQQRDIKLKMMASQINPHFLFNALESIRMKAHMQGQAELAAIVRSLGKLLRKNLEIGGGRIPLTEELEIVRCYLEIQTFRFEDRLTFKLELDPLARDVPLPPLMIQPLVENAIIHGLESREEGGVVEVRTKLEEDHLHVEVIDNGLGIGPERMAFIERSLADRDGEEGQRIGLRNVHQRLHLTYGEGYGLQITSQPEAGSRIQFMIPIGG